MPRSTTRRAEKREAARKLREARKLNHGLSRKLALCYEAVEKQKKSKPRRWSRFSRKRLVK